MKPTRELLSDISKHAHNQIVYYKYNKGILQISDKYREGRLTALEYTAELSLYYMNMEKQIRIYFIEQIDKQMKTNSCLPESEYKDGLYDGLNEVLNEYSKINL